MTEIAAGIVTKEWALWLKHTAGCVLCVKAVKDGEDRVAVDRACCAQGRQLRLAAHRSTDPNRS